MAFWSDAGLEPKRKHKFLLFLGSLPAILCKSVNKPNMEITVGEHKFLGNSYKFPGGIKWNDMTATFIDTENDQIVKQIYDIMYAAGNQSPVEKGLALQGGGTALKLFDKSGAVSALAGGVILQQIDEEGNVVEQWDLMNAWISKLDLGDVAYENDNALSEYKMTIVYDWAELSNANITLSPTETEQSIFGATGGTSSIRPPKRA